MRLGHLSSRHPMAGGAFFAQTCTVEEAAQIAAVEHTEAVLA
jgi:hypothetical protein